MDTPEQLVKEPTTLQPEKRKRGRPKNEDRGRTPGTPDAQEALMTPVAESLPPRASGPTPGGPARRGRVNWISLPRGRDRSDAAPDGGISSLPSAGGADLQRCSRRLYGSPGSVRLDLGVIPSRFGYDLSFRVDCTV